MRTDVKNNTPTLAETIQTIIEYYLVDMHVCLPGKVDKYDADTQMADVQPQLLRQFESGQVVTLPIIPNVPVCHPRANGGQMSIHVPLAPGDDVTIVFAERSLDLWKAQGGLTNPNDRRRFNLSDAFCVPGGSAVPQAFKVTNPKDIEITNGTSMISISPDGKYKIKGGNSDELISLMSDFIAGVARSFTATALGPQALIDPMDPGFTIIKAKIDAFKE